MQVLKDISLGYTIKEIASRLYLSEHTIITHKKKLLYKLDAMNSPSLVRKGFEAGILQMEY